ncbi:MAG TPA: hypothetical protein ENJ82_08665, partial [Bacteroidetes bacterium]|nr:hypothetical protein [Bacteroidota bacterium]
MKIETNIATIDTGNLQLWKGLNDVWTRQALQELYKEPLSCVGYTIAGVRYQNCSVHLPNQAQALQCFMDESGKCKLLRLEDIELPISANALKEQIGEPVAIRTLPENSIYAPAEQWVYPQKGLTLYVLQPDSIGPLAISCAVF